MKHAKELDKERLRGVPRGPLHGVPILLKVRSLPHGRDMRHEPTQTGRIQYARSRHANHLRLVRVVRCCCKSTRRSCG